MTDAEFVVVSLADDDAVRAVYTGDDGIIAGLAKDSIVLDTSTIFPGTVRDLAEQVKARGAHLLDTPVSGSVALVQRGELTVLAGGEAAALDRARPILGAFGSRIVHLGGTGCRGHDEACRQLGGARAQPGGRRGARARRAGGRGPGRSV